MSAVARWSDAKSHLNPFKSVTKRHQIVGIVDEIRRTCKVRTRFYMKLVLSSFETGRQTSAACFVDQSSPMAYGFRLMGAPIRFGGVPHSRYS